MFAKKEESPQSGKGLGAGGRVGFGTPSSLEGGLWGVQGGVSHQLGWEAPGQARQPSRLVHWASQQGLA